jgi:hypothetical protein
VVYIHTGDFLAIKKNKIMSFSGKWMEPNVIILSEISQIQKVKYFVSFVSYRIYISKKERKVPKQKGNFWRKRGGSAGGAGEQERVMEIFTPKNLYRFSYEVI